MHPANCCLERSWSKQKVCRVLLSIVGFQLLLSCRGWLFLDGICFFSACFSRIWGGKNAGDEQTWSIKIKPFFLTNYDSWKIREKMTLCLIFECDKSTFIDRAFKNIPLKHLSSTASFFVSKPASRVIARPSNFYWHGPVIVTIVGRSNMIMFTTHVCRWTDVCRPVTSE